MAQVYLRDSLYNEIVLLRIKPADFVRGAVEKELKEIKDGKSITKKEGI